MIERTARPANGRRRLCCLFGGAVTITTLVLSCSLSPPQAPTWQTEINLPLINHRFTIEELLGQTDNFRADSLGQMHFSHTEALEQVSVGEHLYIKKLHRSLALRLGKFIVNTPTPFTASVSLRQIQPASENLAGQTLPLEPFSFSVQISEFGDNSDFDWVEEVQGMMTLRLQNDLPVALDRPLQFELRNNTLDTVIARVAFQQTILPGQEATVTIPLQESSFSSAVSASVLGSSPGTGAEAITIDPEARLNLEVGFSELLVGRARARLGSQSLQGSDNFAFSDSLLINSASIRSGTVRLAMTSSLPVSAWVVAELPDFVAPNGAALRDSLQMGAATTSTIEVDLTGYSFRPQSASFGQQLIRYVWRARTEASTAEVIELDQESGVAADLVSSHIVFDSITGALDRHTIVVPPQSIKLNLPDEIASLSLPEAALELHIVNGIQLPLELDLLLVGRSRSGNNATLVVQSMLQPADRDGTPVVSHVVFDRHNSNLIEFLSNWPQTVQMTGQVFVGTRDHLGTVRASDGIGGTLRFHTPLAFVLPPQTLEIDGDSVETSVELRQRLLDKLAAGSVTARLLNHLPVGAIAALHFAKNKGTVFSDPDLIIDDLAVATPAIDALTGRVHEPQLSQLQVVLTVEQLQLFQHSPLHTGLVIHLDGSNGAVARLWNSDYLEVQAAATLSISVDEESVN